MLSTCIILYYISHSLYLVIISKSIVLSCDDVKILRIHRIRILRSGLDESNGVWNNHGSSINAPDHLEYFALKSINSSFTTM